MVKPRELCLKSILLEDHPNQVGINWAPWTYNQLGNHPNVSNLKPLAQEKDKAVVPYTNT